MILPSTETGEQVEGIIEKVRPVDITLSKLGTRINRKEIGRASKMLRKI